MVMAQGQISDQYNGTGEESRGTVTRGDAGPPSFHLLSPETEFTSALVSHLYKVFLTHGFPNDTFFPATYSSGYAVNNKDQR